MLRRAFIKALAAAIASVAALYVPGRPWMLGVQPCDWLEALRTAPVFPSGEMLCFEARIGGNGEVDWWRLVEPKGRWE